MLQNEIRKLQLNNKQILENEKEIHKRLFQYEEIQKANISKIESLSKDNVEISNENMKENESKFVILK